MIAVDHSVHLFGSRSRGDWDGASDVDVLVVLDDANAALRIEAIQAVKLEYGSIFEGAPISVSAYTVDRLREIYGSGSLFAWHLATESRTLSPGRDFLAGIGVPSPYLGLLQDLDDLSSLSASIVAALEEPEPTLAFEAGLVYLVLRNAGIVSSKALCGEMIFGRDAPFAVERASGITIGVNRVDYTTLMSCRSLSIRGEITPRVELDWVRHMAVIARRWVRDLKGAAA